MGGSEFRTDASVILRDFDVEDVVEHTLNSLEFETADFDLEAVTADVQVRLGDLADELSTPLFGYEMARVRLAYELEAERRSRYDWPDALVSLCFGAGSVWYFAQPDQRDVLSDIQNPYRWILAFLAGVIVSFLVGDEMGWHRPSTSPVTRVLVEEDFFNEQAVVFSLLGTEVANLTREVVNDRLRHAAETVGYVLTSTAPALVDQDVSRVVPGATMREVEEFIDEHNTSAIGLAGPRGVGKTTVIRRVCHSTESHIGVYVQAPVVYDAPDFVRFLHTRVAQAVLQAHGGSLAADVRSATWWQRWGRVLLATAFACAALVALSAGDIRLGLPTARNAWRIAGIVLLVVSITVVGSDLWRRMRAARGLRARDSAVGLAQGELHRLGWTTERQQGGKVGVGLAKWYNFEASDQVKLMQREETHPERVASFTTFVASYQRLRDARTLVIGVDELDKLPSGEELIDAVNGLKDLFHTRNTHFVVSVSEEALHRFASRGVPVRDAFDSAFDTVIRARRLTAGESVSLLRQRAVELNDPVLLFCHAWGGGLPRDVIRAARACVAKRRVADFPLPLEAVAPHVVQEDVIEVVAAAIRRTRDGEASLPLGALIMLHHALERPDGPFLDDIELFLTEWNSPPAALDGEANWFAQSLGQYLRVAAAVYDYFGRARSPEKWADDLMTGATTEAAEMLATAVAALAMLPAEAEHRAMLAVERLELRRLGRGVPGA